MGEITKLANVRLKRLSDAITASERQAAHAATGLSQTYPTAASQAAINNVLSFAAARRSSKSLLDNGAWKEHDTSDVVEKAGDCRKSSHIALTIPKEVDTLMSSTAMASRPEAFSISRNSASARVQAKLQECREVRLLVVETLSFPFSIAVHHCFLTESGSAKAAEHASEDGSAPTQNCTPSSAFGACQALV